MSSVTRVEFGSDGMSYIILRGCWCDIDLNVRAPTDDKIGDMKDSFCKELKHLFDKFPKYHFKNLLGDFNAKIGREEIFKPTVGNESLHEISHDSEVRIVNYATSKNLTVKSTMFPHCNIHKYTWTLLMERHNKIDRILIDGDGIQVYLMSSHSGQQILTTVWWCQNLRRDWQ
jgi:hypothetical protein